MSEEYILEDGRKAEKRETKPEESTKVIEVYVEPKLEKRLKQRVVEKYCVCEREIQELDENTGEVINTVIEKVFDPTEATEINRSEVKKSFIEMEVENKIKNRKVSVTNMILVGLIMVQVLGLVYFLLN